MLCRDWFYGNTAKHFRNFPDVDGRRGIICCTSNWKQECSGIRINSPNPAIRWSTGCDNTPGTTHCSFNSRKGHQGQLVFVEVKKAVVGKDEVAGNADIRSQGYL